MSMVIQFKLTLIGYQSQEFELKFECLHTFGTVADDRQIAFKTLSFVFYFTFVNITD